VVAARAGLGQFTNPRGEILANARYRAERLLVELDDGLWPGGECLGRRAVSAYLEGVVASNFEEVGDLGQNL
jgi:hypothetical protein